MMLRTALGPAYVWQLVWASAFLLMLLAWVIVSRSARGKRQPPVPEMLPSVIDALSVYLGGNRDTTVLRALAAKHPAEVRETILQYQTVLAGQCDGLCELAITLGYVQTWWYDTQSIDLVRRREAFSRIAAMAWYEPVRRVVGDLAEKSFRDPDEQIRIDVCRILLASANTADVARVFEAAIVDTQRVRSVIGPELAPYAAELCENAVPWALRAENPIEILKMLVSWERALPLTNVRWLMRHTNPLVRRETMNLLRYLPATAENQATIFAGLSDDNRAVRDAATAAIRVGQPKADLTPGATEELGLVRAETAEIPSVRLAIVAGPCSTITANGKPTSNPFTNWRVLDVQNQS